MTIRHVSLAAILTNAYLLLMGACLYLWPNIAGIATFPSRVLWVIGSLPLFFYSAWSLHRSLKKAPALKNNLTNLPWLLLILLCLGLSFPLFAIPLHAFTDEINIVLPSLTLAHRLARMMTWPVLQGVLILLLALSLFACLKLRPKQVALVVVFMALIAITAAWFIGQKSPLATRFPPLVNIFQMLGTIIGEGRVELARAPNMLWTILLVVGFWQFTPHWSLWSRYGGLAALLLGPMGWVYRISLYQACGEITLGIVAVLLLTDILREKKYEALAPYLGLLLSLWMLYRPTSFVVLCLSIGVLWIFHRRQAALTITKIALPIAILWIIMYPTYKYPFLLQKDILFPAAESKSLMQPIIGFLTHLPNNFHPVAIVILLLGSLLIFLQSNNTFRIGLALAWLIGLIASGMQQLIQEPHFYGYPRFNILMLLPFAFIIAGLLSNIGFSKRLGTIIGSLSMVALLLVTPFDYVTFAHTLRRSADGIYQTPTGGDSPLPVMLVGEDIIRESPDAIFLVPDVTFLDLYIAIGLLTPTERSALIEQSRAWTPDNSTRPVVIQAPVVTTYQPNMSAVAEERLKQAAVWAKNQPNHQIVRLGLEEVIIVY